MDFRLVKSAMIKKIPSHMHGGVELYLRYGLEPGSFQRAMLECDFNTAFSRADLINRKAFYVWTDFVLNDMPADSVGSKEKVNKWISERRGA